MPGAPSSFLLLVVRPGAPSSVLFSGPRQRLGALPFALEIALPCRLAVTLGTLIEVLLSLLRLRLANGCLQEPSSDGNRIY